MRKPLSSSAFSPSTKWLVALFFSLCKLAARYPFAALNLLFLTYSALVVNATEEQDEHPQAILVDKGQFFDIDLPNRLLGNEEIINSLSILPTPAFPGWLSVNQTVGHLQGIWPVFDPAQQVHGQLSVWQGNMSKTVDFVLRSGRAKSARILDAEYMLDRIDARAAYLDFNSDCDGNFWLSGLQGFGEDGLRGVITRTTKDMQLAWMARAGSFQYFRAIAVEPGSLLIVGNPLLEACTPCDNTEHGWTALHRDGTVKLAKTVVSEGVYSSEALYQLNQSHYLVMGYEGGFRPYRSITAHLIDGAGEHLMTYSFGTPDRTLWDRSFVDQERGFLYLLGRPPSMINSTYVAKVDIKDFKVLESVRLITNSSECIILIDGQVLSDGKLLLSGRLWGSDLTLTQGLMVTLNHTDLSIIQQRAYHADSWYFRDLINVDNYSYLTMTHHINDMGGVVQLDTDLNFTRGFQADIDSFLFIDSLKGSHSIQINHLNHRLIVANVTKFNELAQHQEGPFALTPIDNMTEQAVTLLQAPYDLPQQQHAPSAVDITDQPSTELFFNWQPEGKVQANTVGGVGSIDAISQSLKQGLVAYYSFDEGWNDQSVAGLHAVANGGAILTKGWRQGTAKFPGGSNHLDLGTDFHQEFSDQDDFAFAAWVQLDDHTSTQGIFCMSSDDPAMILAIRKRAPAGELVVNLHQPVEENSKRRFYFDAGITDSNWHHITLNYGRSPLKLECYVDGVLVPRVQPETYGELLPVMFSKTLRTHLGQVYITNPIQPLQGQLDDVMILRRQLSPTEIDYISRPNFKFKLITEKSDGLGLHLSFDQGFVDQSDYHHPVIMRDTVTLVDDLFGNPQGAAKFNNNGYLEIPHHFSIQPRQTLTVSMWLKVDGVLDRYSNLICKCPTSTGDLPPGVERQVAIYLQPGDNKIFYEASYDLSKLLLVNHHYSSMGTWVHVTWVGNRRTQSQKLFINGMFEKQRTQNYLTFDNKDTSFFIGYKPSQLPNGGLNATIDELRFYRRALSDREVIEQYQQDLARIADFHAYDIDRLVGYFPFNQTLNDFSGLKHHGVANKTAIYTKSPAGHEKDALLLTNNSWIEIPYTALLQPKDQLTISMWLQINVNDGEYQPIMTKPNGEIGANYHFSLCYRQQALRVIYATGSNSYEQHAIENPPFKNWFYLTVVQDRQRQLLQFYINSDLQFQFTLNAGAFATHSSPLWLGKGHSLVNELHYAKQIGVDELRIYTRTLLAHEIAQLYQQEMVKVTLSQTKLDTNLVAYFPFDNNEVNDQGPYAHAVSAQGVVGFTSGRYHDAAAFDGKVGKGWLAVNSLSNHYTSQSDMAISVWLKASKPSTVTTILGLNSNNGATNILLLVILPANGELAVRCSGGANLDLESVTDNSWHHVVFNFARVENKLTVYIDGVEVVTDLSCPLPLSDADRFSIAQEYDDNLVESDFFDGLLDELYIFDKALMHSEIHQLFQYNTLTARGTENAGIESIKNGLIAYYPFDDNYLDQTFYQHHAIAHANPEFIEGIKGKAVKLGGPTEQDWIEVPSVIFQQFDDFTSLTISAWIATDIDSGRNLFITLNSDTVDNIIWFDVKKSQSIFSQSPNIYYDYPSSELWHYYTIVYDGDQLAYLLYKDGEKVLPSSISNPFYHKSRIRFSQADSFNIGQEFDGENPSDFFTGSIDELRIYNRALSPAEARELYLYEQRAFFTMMSNNPVHMVASLKHELVSGQFFSTNLVKAPAELLTLTVPESLSWLNLADNQLTGVAPITQTQTVDYLNFTIRYADEDYLMQLGLAVSNRVPRLFNSNYRQWQSMSVFNNTDERYLLPIVDMENDTVSVSFSQLPAGVSVLDHHVQLTAAAMSDDHFTLMIDDGKHPPIEKVIGVTVKSGVPELLIATTYILPNQSHLFDLTVLSAGSDFYWLEQTGLGSIGSLSAPKQNLSLLPIIDAERLYHFYDADSPLLLGQTQLNQLQPNGNDWVLVDSEPHIGNPLASAKHGSNLFISNHEGLQWWPHQSGFNQSFQLNFPAPQRTLVATDQVVFGGDDRPRLTVFCYGDGKLYPENTLPLLSTPNSLLINNQHLLVASNEQLEVIDIRDPLNPVYCSSYPVNGGQAVLQHGVLTLMAETSSLAAFDVSEPLRSVWLDRIQLPGQYQAWEKQDNLLFVATLGELQDNQLAVYSLEQLPFKLLRRYSLSASPTQIFTIDEKLWLLDPSKGVFEAEYGNFSYQWRVDASKLAHGNHSVTMSIRDGLTATLPQRFNLSVNQPPTLSPLASVVVTSSGEAFNRTGTLFDPDDDPLTLHVKAVGHESLPNWLEIISSGNEFAIVGTPGVEQRGQLDVVVIVRDPYNGEQQRTFTIYLSNDVPRVNLDYVFQLNQLALYINTKNTIDLTPLCTDFNALFYESSLAWAKVNGSRLEVNAPIQSQGLHAFNLTCYDLFGAENQTSLELAVRNRAPRNVTLFTKTAQVDSAIIFTLTNIPEVDQDGDPLQLLYLPEHQPSGALLPWLTFNTETRQFIGSAPVGSTGEYSLVFGLQDTYNALGFVELPLLITSTKPIVQKPIIDQRIIAEKEWVYSVPADTFFDADADPLTYRAELSGGRPLPEWLTFDEAQRLFIGDPGMENVGKFSITVRANDGLSDALAVFNLEVTNEAPVINILPFDHQFKAGRFFELKLPNGTFVDPDGHELDYTIDYDAVAAPWLHHSAPTLSLWGKPPVTAIGHYLITLLASDGDAEVITNFDLSIVNERPELFGQINDVFIEVGSNQSLHVDKALFEDPDDPTLFYSATLADGSVLPAWIRFDAVDPPIFQFLPSRFEEGTTTIKLLASDGQFSASTRFEVVVIPSLRLVSYPQQLTFIEDTALIVPPLVVDSPTRVSLSMTLSVRQAGQLYGGNDSHAFSSRLGKWEFESNITRLNDQLSRLVFYPAKNFDQNFEISIVVVDEINKPLREAIEVTGVSQNDAPLVSDTIPALSFVEDAAFSYIYPAGLFSDVDGDELSITLSSDTGDTPEWLVFSAEKRVISGKPPIDSEGQYRLQLVASDGVATVKYPFTINVVAGSNFLTQIDPTLLGTVGGSVLLIATTLLLHCRGRARLRHVRKTLRQQRGHFFDRVRQQSTKELSLTQETALENTKTIYGKLDNAVRTFHYTALTDLMRELEQSVLQLSHRFPRISLYSHLTFANLMSFMIDQLRQKIASRQIDTDLLVFVKTQRQLVNLFLIAETTAGRPFSEANKIAMLQQLLQIMFRYPKQPDINFKVYLEICCLQQAISSLKDADNFFKMILRNVKSILSPGKLVANIRGLVAYVPNTWYMSLMMIELLTPHALSDPALFRDLLRLYWQPTSMVFRLKGLKLFETALHSGVGEVARLALHGDKEAKLGGLKAIINSKIHCLGSKQHFSVKVRQAAQAIYEHFSQMHGDLTQRQASAAWENNPMRRALSMDLSGRGYRESIVEVRSQRGAMWSPNPLRLKSKNSLEKAKFSGSIGETKQDSEQKTPELVGASTTTKMDFSF